MNIIDNLIWSSYRLKSRLRVLLMRWDILNLNVTKEEFDLWKIQGEKVEAEATEKET